MMSILQKFIGPRIPTDSTGHKHSQYMIPALLLGVAAILLLISTYFPYWEMDLFAPQYPQGLHVTAYTNRLTGDIFEIDLLNHYIGMRPLEEAAQFERSISVIAIVTLSLLIVAATLIHTKWVTLFAFPAVIMPLIFLGDLYWWLRNFGLNLNEEAPLSNAIDPFVPPVLGRGVIGQFETVASPGTGLYLATIASIIVIVSLYYHRKLYKPLVDGAL